MIQKLENNFMLINNHDIESTSKLWLYDMLGFIYGHISDEMMTELVARSDKKVWEYEQYQNLETDLAYERSVGKW